MLTLKKKPVNTGEIHKAPSWPKCQEVVMPTVYAESALFMLRVLCLSRVPGRPRRREGCGRPGEFSQNGTWHRTEGLPWVWVVVVAV